MGTIYKQSYFGWISITDDMKYTWLLLEILNQCTNCKKSLKIVFLQKLKSKKFSNFYLNFEASETSKVI